MIKNILIILALMTTLVSNVSAQEEKEQTDKVEVMKIGFITQKLNLTTNEAKVFWPVYNEFSIEQKKLREKINENVLIFKAKTNMSAQEANKFISDQLILKQSLLDLKKKYMNEFKKVLPENKVALLLIIEDEFKQQLLNRLNKDRERINKQPPIQR